MTEQQERLARIETQLTHIAQIVERAEKTRDTQVDQLARLDQRLQHVERVLPNVDDNTKKTTRSEGWQSAKQDTEKDHRATAALAISTLALLVTAYSVFTV